MGKRKRKGGHQTEQVIATLNLIAAILTLTAAALTAIKELLR